MASTADVHLVVLIHGLWGNASHMQYLENALRSTHPELELLVCQTNEGTRTYDGIDVCAERVVAEVEERAKSLNVARFSVIGYSLGGLIGRYAVAVLYDKGFFEHVTPVNFTTFATPHLGARAVDAGVWSSIFNSLGPKLLSESGKQIFVADQFRDSGKPLLQVMASGNFIKALSLFQQRALYGNIQNDRTAVYYTTTISLSDPYRKMETIKVNSLAEYAAILDPDQPHEILEVPRTIIDPRSYRRILMFFLFPIFSSSFFFYSLVQTFRSQSRIMSHKKIPISLDKPTPKLIQDAPPLEAAKPDDLPLLPEQVEMAKNLNELKWHKHLVNITATYWTHAAIIVRRENADFEEGKTVVKHWLSNEFIV